MALVLLLVNLGSFEFRLIETWWPLVFIIAGLARVLRRLAARHGVALRSDRAI
jgi:hypothetical protein